MSCMKQDQTVLFFVFVRGLLFLFDLTLIFYISLNFSSDSILLLVFGR